MMMMMTMTMTTTQKCTIRTNTYIQEPCNCWLCVVH